MPKKKEYDNTSISMLKGADRVRKRPGVIFGSDDIEGCTHGFFEIGRMIAAHHGRNDWGAIIDLDEKNLEAELYLLHHVDDISAKFGAIKADDLT